MGGDHAWLSCSNASVPGTPTPPSSRAERPAPVLCFAFEAVGSAYHISLGRSTGGWPSRQCCGGGASQLRTFKRRVPRPLASLTASAADAPGVGSDDPQEPAAWGQAHDVFQKGDALQRGRYVLGAKLADGRFTTLWAADDSWRRRRVVIKLMESGSSEAYAAGMAEAAVHALACPHSNIAALLATFEERSAGGRHAGLVLEPLGPDMAAVLGSVGGGVRMGLPMPVVKAAARQLLRALDHLHRECGIVHMGIKPEHVLLDKPFASIHSVSPVQVVQQRLVDCWRQLTRKPPQGLLPLLQREGVYSELDLHTATCKLVDFGRALELPASFPRSLRGAPAAPPPPATPTKPVAGLGAWWRRPWRQRPAATSSQPGWSGGAAGPAAQGGDMPLHLYPGRGVVFPGREAAIIFGAPGYRPPEEVLALEYRAPAYDVWGLGCTLFALATGQDLFAPAAGPDTDVNDAHLAEMVGVLGRLPRELLGASPLRRRYFRPASSRLMLEQSYEIASEPLISILTEEHGMSSEEASGLADFLGLLLEYDPRRRPTAAQLLAHPWLEDVAGVDAQDGEQQ